MRVPCRFALPCRLALPFTTWAALAAVCSAVALHGDEIRLKNGKTLDGEVIKEDDDYIVVRVPYGEVKLRADDVESIERQSSTEYKLRLGRKWLQQRNYERAVRSLEEVFLAERTNAEARRMLATAYDQYASHLRDHRRFAEARTCYENLLKIDPAGEAIAHVAKTALANLARLEAQTNELLDTAREAAKRRDWDGAITGYRAALEYTPDVRGTVASEAALCHVQRALLRAQAQDYASAARDLEDALSSDPALADRVERTYVSFALPGILGALQRGDLAAAKNDLQRVVTFAPTNPYALYVSGRLEESLGRRADAAQFYGRALRTRVAAPTPEYLAELRGRVEKELKIAGDKIAIDTTFAELTGYAESSAGPAQQLETEHFLILHYNPVLAAEVAARAESERTRIQQELKLTGWRGKARIFLHRSQAEYTARTAQPEWTGGYSRVAVENGRVSGLEIHSWQTSPRLLTSVLPHEIMHLLVYANSAEPLVLARSLHEGFAILAEPKFRHEYFLNFLRLRLKSEAFIPLADLLTARDYPKDPDFFYAEGFALVKFIADTKGADAALALLRSISTANQNQSEVLRATGYTTLNELETAWKAWILR